MTFLFLFLEARRAESQSNVLAYQAQKSNATNKDVVVWIIM